MVEAGGSTQTPEGGGQRGVALEPIEYARSSRVVPLGDWLYNAVGIMWAKGESASGRSMSVIGRLGKSGE